MQETVFDGDAVQGGDPEWGPLLATVGEALVRDFMWMYEVELENGTEVQAYKHIDTRRYVHLDAAGRAYAYESPGRYRSVPVADVLREVFKPLLPGLFGVTAAQIRRSWEAVVRLDTTPRDA
jgi:hypothetical protein